MKSLYTLLVIFLLFLVDCDRGLAPSEPETKITSVSGTVYFKNWPPPDSIFDLRLLLFLNYPLTDIQSEILSGKVVIYPTLADTTRLPFYVDSLNYRIVLNPGTYKYFTVAQQYGPNYLQDWQVVGTYDTLATDTLPTSVVLTEGVQLENINIHANFDSVLFRP
jgi:hypothetical protein